jgi:CRP/FNR family transcriptional regulator, cyclic AMP receptor protein
VRRVSVSRHPSLKGLKNLSWLKASQQRKLANALLVTRVERRGIIFDEGSSTDTAYILMSGVARITCRNRKGHRVQVIVLPPGMIPAFPPPIMPGIKCDFRCEAAAACQIGTVDLEKLLEIALGQIASTHFKQMATNYMGQWNAVQMRCANFMTCTLGERLALTLLELGQDFGVDSVQGLRLTVSTRQKELAELVGVSRPRMTEQLGHFARSHMIEWKGKYLIIKRDRLESFLLQTHSENGGGEVREADGRRARLANSATSAAWTGKQARG